MHHRDFTQNIIQLLVRVRNKKTRKLAGYIFRDKKQKQNCTFYNFSLQIFTIKNTPSDNTKKGQRDSENLKVFVTNFLINRPTNRLTGKVREMLSYVKVTKKSYLFKTQYPTGFCTKKSSTQTPYYALYNIFEVFKYLEYLHDTQYCLAAPRCTRPGAYQNIIQPALCNDYL